MQNRDHLPSITAIELHAFLENSQEEGVVLDVREAWELARARLQDPRVLHIPMSRLQRFGDSALPASCRDATRVLVMCHHGQRSAAVTAWLRSHATIPAFNVSGGIDAYSQLPDVGLKRY